MNTWRIVNFAALLLLLTTFGMVIYLMVTVKQDEKFTTSEILTETSKNGLVDLQTIDLRTTIDEAINDTNGPLLPYTARPGMIVMWHKPDPPVGWAICDGNGFLSDNKTPVPDLRGRFPGGISGNAAFAAQGGAGTVTLTVANMPQHTHAQSQTLSRWHDGSCPKACRGGTDCEGVCDVDAQTYPAGGGQPFDITPLYTLVYFIIKL